MEAKKSKSARTRAIVLYDEDCGFCRWSAALIEAWDRRGQIRTLAIQSSEGQQLLEPVPSQSRLDSFHLVEPDGSVHSAGAAAAPLLRRLPLGRLPSRMAQAMPRATNRAYFFVADRRTFFGRILHRLGWIPPASHNRL